MSTIQNGFLDRFLQVALVSKLMTVVTQMMTAAMKRMRNTTLLSTPPRGLREQPLHTSLETPKH